MKRKMKILWELAVMILAKICSVFCKDKNIWLLTEKRTEARDNGYWFYKYMKEKHPECNTYYVINKKVPDYEKVAKYGADKIIEPDSWKHCVYYWAAKYNVSSQPFGAHPFNYFSVIKRIDFLKRKGQIIIFLQHGIIKDELSHSLDYSVSKIDMFCVSTKREREAVIKTHGYPTDLVTMTGLCRYDNLNHNCGNKKQILVMPTFRHWLMAADEAGKPTKTETDRFLADDFYKKYYSLLSSEKLEKLLEEYDYNLVFYPHYSAQCYLKLYEDKSRSKRVQLASRLDHDVQQLLQESKILITDFSSIYFDFAYMRKPEIYYQFDEDRYRGDHYKEGYFSYKKDGFGPVVKEEGELLDYLRGLLDNNAVIEEQYLKRIDDFFEYSDNGNCERTFRAIMRIKNAK